MTIDEGRLFTGLEHLKHRIDHFVFGHIMVGFLYFFLHFGQLFTLDFSFIFKLILGWILKDINKAFMLFNKLSLGIALLKGTLNSAGHAFGDKLVAIGLLYGIGTSVLDPLHFPTSVNKRFPGF